MFKLFYNATLAITGGTAITGGIGGSYLSYQESKDKSLIMNVAYTTFGGMVGCLGGIGVGFSWPIASTVIFARLLEENKQIEKKDI